MVPMTVRDVDRQWSGVHPAFLTTELQELVR
jgi:hypothetical protein